MKPATAMSFVSGNSRKSILRAALILRRESSFWERLDRVRSLQGASEADLLALQNDAAVRLLRDVLVDVPYYSGHRRDLCTVQASEVRQALRNLPVIHKHVLQSDGDQLRKSGFSGPAMAKTTGGSTGRPVTVVKNSEAVAQEMAASWMAYDWFGLRPADPCVRFWGMPVRNVRRRLRYIAADVATNRTTLSAFGYTERDLARYLNVLRRKDPIYLYGYVSSLEELARFASTRLNWTPPNRLKAIVSTAEVLSDPQRHIIESAFGVPVQNEYGCGEVGPIAYQCPSGSLHLLPMNHLVEILDDDGNPVAHGSPGNIVVTDLTNIAMPLVRYSVGDIGALGEPCSCGRGFPVLKYVLGRAYDYIETPSGRRFHGEYFMYLFEDLRKRLPGIGQFQVSQTSPTDLVLRVVLNSPGEVSALETLLHLFRQRMPEMNARVERVETISRRPSGKMLVVERAF